MPSFIQEGSLEKKKRKETKHGINPNKQQRRLAQPHSFDEAANHQKKPPPRPQDPSSPLPSLNKKRKAHVNQAAVKKQRKTKVPDAVDKSGQAVEEELNTKTKKPSAPRIHTKSTDATNEALKLADTVIVENSLTRVSSLIRTEGSSSPDYTYSEYRHSPQLVQLRETPKYPKGGRLLYERNEDEGAEMMRAAESEARCVHMTAKDYMSQDNYAAAINQFRRAIYIFERVMPGSLALAFCYHDAGFAYEQQGNYTTAAKHYHCAIQIYLREIPGSETLAECHRDAAFTYEQAYVQQEKYAAAMNQFYRAIMEHAMPGAVAFANCDLVAGSTNEQQHNYTAAVEQVQCAIQIYQRKLPGSIKLAQLYGFVATLYIRKGNYTASVEEHQRAIQIYQQEMPRSEELAECHSFVGFAYKQQGNYRAAVEQYLRAIGTYKHAMPGSVALAECHRDTGSTYDDQRNFTAAIEQYQCAIQIYQRLMPGSVALAKCHRDAAFSYEQQHNYTAAEEQYQSAIRICQREMPGSVELARLKRHVALMPKGYLGFLVYRQWIPFLVKWQKLLLMRRPQTFR